MTALVLATTGFGAAGSAYAQNTIYTYTADSTANWSSAAAWSSGVVPVSSATTQLNFNGSGANGYTATNDIGAGFLLNEILLNGSNGSAGTISYNIAGASLALSPAASIVEAGVAAFNISNAITLNSDFLSITNTSSGSLSLYGVISGTGGIAKTTGSNLTLAGVNTFTGGVNISTGTVLITNAAGLGTGTVTALNAATIDTSAIAVGNTIANAVVLPNSGRLTLNINGSTGTTKFSGLLSGGTTSSSLYLNTNAGTAAGVYEFSNANSSFVTSTSSGITLNRGTLQVDNAGALGNASNGVYLDSYSPNSLIFGSSFTYTHPTALAYATSSWNTSTYNVIASGVISGSVAITKTGTGELTLTAANSYSGTTAVSVGALVGGLTAAFPSFGTTAITVASGATLGGRVGGTTDFTTTNIATLEQKDTFAAGSYLGIDTTDGNFSYGDPGAVNAAIGLNKLGINNLTLTTAGTYTGGTQISAGSLIPAVPNALSSGNIFVQSGGNLNIAAGTTVNSNATFYANVGGSSSIATVGSGTLNLNLSTGSATNPDLVFGANHNGTAYDGATVSAPINLGSSQRYIWGYDSHNGIEYYNLAGGDAVLAGSMSGTGGITIIGKNDTYETDTPVQFALTGSNTFTGAVVIVGGSVYLGNNNAIPSGDALSLTPATGDIARLFIYGTNTTVSNLSSSGAGSALIANGNKLSLAKYAVAAGTLTTNQTTNTTFSGTITDAYGEYAATGTNNQGNFSLVKTGPASLVLNGTLSYTGTTTINAGTLEIDVADTTSLVTVNAGTLAGKGSISGSVNVLNGGALTAGAVGAGNLTVGSLNLGVNSGDTSTINVSQAADVIDGGALTLASGAVSTINVGGAASGFSVGSSYPLITYNASATAVSPTFTLGTLPTRVLGSLAYSTGVVSLNVTGVDFPIWTGAATSLWNTTDVNWALNSSNSTSTTYMPGDTVLFSDLAGAAHTNVVINGADVFPGGVTFNTSLNYTLSGTNGINGSTGLVVSGNGAGNGSLTINNTNSFTGNVNISNATVSVPTIAYAGIASPLGAGTSIILNAGTLNYTGAVAATTDRSITLGASGGAINVNTSGSSLTLVTSITGTSTLSVSGAGTLIMGTPNTAFSGPIVVNSGNLSVSADTDLGAVPAAVTPAAITLNGTASLIATAGFTLNANRGITGPGSVIISAGTLVLTSSNTYTGGTFLNGGTLEIGNTHAAGTGPIVVGAVNVSSTFLNTSLLPASLQPIANAIVLPNDTQATTHQIYITGGTGSDVQFNGNISGGSVNTELYLNNSVADGTGVFEFNGANTFVTSPTPSVGIYLNRGTLEVDGASALGNASNGVLLDSYSPNSIIFGSSFTYTHPTQISYTLSSWNTGSNTVTVSAPITGTYGINKIGTGTLILANVSSYTAATTVAAGILQIGNGGTSGSLPTGQNVNISSGATLVFNHSDSVAFANIIAGAGALTKMGTGTVILSGANTFTGATTVNAGQLQVDGSLAAGSTVSVNSGGTLTGAGTIGGAVNLNSGGALNGTGTVLGPVTLSNNSSIGTSSTLTVGALNFGAVSTDTSVVNLISAISGSSPAPSQIVDTGGINVSSGTNTVTINITGIPLATNTYHLIDYSNSTPSLTSISSFQLGTLPAGVVANLVNDTSNSSIDLNVTAGDYPKWTGLLNSEWVTTPQVMPYNWQLTYAGTPTNYVDGNTVMFDDTASNSNVDISSGNVSPNSVAFTNNSLTYTITGTNGIAGSTGVTMSGSGNVIFSNLNTYTGDTVIKNGSITVTKSSTATAGPLGTGTIRVGDTVNTGDSATLTLSSAAGTGGLIVSNPIIVQSGTSGVLTIQSNDTAGINALSGNITLGSGTGAANLTLLANAGGELDINGNIVSNGATAGNLTIGNGSYTGTVKFNGTSTYNGGLTVNAGTLVSAGTTVPSYPNAMVVNGGATFVDTGTLTLLPTTVGANTSGDALTSVSGNGTIALNSSSSSLTSPDITATLTTTADYAINVTPNIVVGPGNHFIEGESGNNSYGEYATGDLTFSGPLSGSGNLTLYGTPASSQFELALFSDNSNWTGSLTIARGDVAGVVNNALTAANNVTFTPASGQIAALYLFGINMTIGNLSGTAAGSMYIRNGSQLNGATFGSDCALTVTQTTNATFSGVISNGPNDYYSGTASTATLGLTKQGPANLTLNGANTYTGDTNINLGTLTLGSNGSLGATNIYVNTGALVFATTPGSGIVTRNLTGTLSVNGGATVTVAAGSHADRQVLVLGGFSNNGLVDLGNSDMDLPNSVGLSTITNQIASGYNGGAWNGTSGITSTSAMNNSTHLTTLGVILNDDGTGTNTPLYGIGGTIATTFSKIIPNDGDILVKYTYYGDTNLDGKVDGTDYSRIDNGAVMGLAGWYNGDFNYDGVINGSDYTLIDNAYNTQGASLAATIAAPTAQIAGGSGSSAVPEPTTLALLGIGAMGLLGRRRRRMVD